MFSRLLCGLLLLAPLTQAEDLKDAVKGYLLAADGPDKPWEVTGTVGLTFTDGNSESLTVAAGVEAKKEWQELWKLLLKWNYLYAESNDVESANELIFLERLDRILDEKSSIFQTLFFEHDEAEGLSVRLIFTIGYERRLMDKEKFKLWGNIGGGVRYEDYRATGDDTSGTAQLGIRWVWNLTDKLTYTQTITFYPNLSEGGEFLMFWESVFSTPISDNMALQLSIIDKYNSDPPVGIKENDLQVTLSLSITFTKKKE